MISWEGKAEPKEKIPAGGLRGQIEKRITYGHVWGKEEKYKKIAR